LVYDRLYVVRQTRRTGGARAYALLTGPRSVPFYARAHDATGPPSTSPLASFRRSLGREVWQSLPSWPTPVTLYRPTEGPFLRYPRRLVSWNVREPVARVICRRPVIVHFERTEREKVNKPTVEKTDAADPFTFRRWISFVFSAPFAPRNRHRISSRRRWNNEPSVRLVVVVGGRLRVRVR